MEDSTEVDVSQKKMKKPRLESESENENSVKKSDEESGKVIPNGTGNSLTGNVPEEKPRAPVKITKISKITKKEPVKEKTKSSSQSPQKILPPCDSPTNSSDFHGFDDLGEKNKVCGKEVVCRIISRLEVLNEKESGGEGGEEEEGGEAMTADDGDTDSNKMEIDEGNSRADSTEFSDKNDKGRTRDSDVDVMETDSVKSGGDVSSKTEEDKGNKTVSNAAVPGSESQAKVEYCGGCNAEVDDAEDGICCDGKCERWFHLQCSGLTQAEYDELGRDENAKWACNRCSGKPPPVIKPGAKPLLTVRKDLTKVATPSPKRKSLNKDERRPRLDISNPIYLKPFDYGWKRELVFRSTIDTQNRRQGDVYYYTPKGKKLRSLREISEHLMGTDLTVDNFTFWKEALGCDPEKEIIRDAKIKTANKDASASPIVAKKLTPKPPKTPKTTPKLTATVTPLDSASGLPVTPTPKASASVTPRVVLKGKTSIGTGPKFKVTPSKTSVPGQTQKIVISKGSEKTTKEFQSPNKVDGSKSYKETKNSEEKTHASKSVGKNHAGEVENEKEGIETTTKNKFRRYGLLANRISTRNIARKRRSKSSSFSSSSSEDLNSPDTQTLISQLEDIRATAYKAREKEKSQVNIKKIASPSLSNSVVNSNSKLSFTPDMIPLSNPSSKRPRSPEIQFRPGDLSSYGCQTSTPSSCRAVGPNLSGNSSLYRPPFETVLIVDTSSTSESFVNSPKSRSGPYKSPSPVQWTHDCSIEVFSVETLPTKDAFSNESYLIASPSKQPVIGPKRQSSFLRASEFGRDGHTPPTKLSNDSSPVSIGSSSSEVVVVDEDPGDNYCPPFLMRNSPPPKLVRNATSNRSPPSLKPILPPPPLLPCPSRMLPEPPQTISVNSSISLDSSEEPEESNTSGSKYDDYRKFKVERFYKRQKRKFMIERLKTSYMKDKEVLMRRKSEEKRVQIEYLRLKVKMKSLKLGLMQDKIATQRMMDGLLQSLNTVDTSV